jgi:hypothetical protein
LAVVNVPRRQLGEQKGKGTDEPGMYTFEWKYFDY